MNQNRVTTPEGITLIAVPQIDDLRPCAGCHWAEDAGTRPGLRCTRPFRLRFGAPCVAGVRDDGRDVVWRPTAAAQPAETFKGWYCAHCQRGVDASEVTFSEQHEACGRVITDDMPPPAAALVPLTDEQIDRAVSAERDALLDHIYEHGTAAEGVIERVRKLARAAVKAASQKSGAA